MIIGIAVPAAILLLAVLLYYAYVKCIRKSSRKDDNSAPHHKLSLTGNEFAGPATSHHPTLKHQLTTKMIGKGQRKRSTGSGGNPFVSGANNLSMNMLGENPSETFNIGVHALSFDMSTLSKVDDDADMSVDVSMSGLEMTKVDGGTKNMKPLYLNDSSMFQTPRNAIESNGVARVDTTGDIGVIAAPSTGIFRVPVHAPPSVSPRRASPSLSSNSVKFVGEFVEDLFVSEESGDDGGGDV